MPTYQNVVVGVHESPSGARVLELASQQADEMRATLTLVTAYQWSSRPAERMLARAAEACAEMGAPAVETLAVPGDPAEVLVETARARGAGLIMVGNHGLSTLNGRLAGSVPDKVISKASDSCDVLIVHTTTDRWRKLVSQRRREPSSNRRVFIVGVHDTPRSMRAVEKAASLAAHSDAELILVGVYHRTEEWHPAGGRKPQVPRALGSVLDALGPNDSYLAMADLSAIDSALANGKVRARARGARRVSTAALPADPVHGLLELTAERDANMVVLGSHPQTRGPARLIGSVSTQVTRRTPLHVLLVH